MVWPGDFLEYHTVLHIFRRGSVMTTRDRDAVLDICVRLYAAAVALAFHFIV